MADVARLNRRLHLIVPIYRGEEETVWGYVHSAPISRATFESNFLVISKAFASIYNAGLGWTAGPRVAALLLRQAAEDTGMWDRIAAGLPDVKNGLMAEIRRLTNLVHIAEGGWQTMAWQSAVTQALVDEDEISEVENAVCFFTLASSMHRRTELQTILDGSLRLWGARVELSNVTEFASSLKTSTVAASSGEKKNPAASLPPH